MLKKEAIEAIERTIGYKFKDKQLLSQAFTRSSYHNEHPEEPDNELLEFIGDSVLSIIVVNILVDRYAERNVSGLCSDHGEGHFSKIKSSLVNKQFLAKQMNKLYLHEYLRMSIGDEAHSVNNSKSVLEDLLESVLGAVYLDSNCNLEQAQKVAEKILNINKFLKINDGQIRISYKNDVQEWCQKNGFDMPYYNTQQTAKGFICYCELSDLDIKGRGKGHNRKEAEINAAKDLLGKIDTTLGQVVDLFVVSFENAINMLQEYCQKNGYKLPEYKTISDEKRDNNSHLFTVCCHIDSRWVNGGGRTVKEAKKQAAYNMLEALGIIN